MKNQMNGSTSFENEDERTLLASYPRSKPSITESNRYKLRLFSNTVPVPVFFLAIAVDDTHETRKGGRG